METDPGQGDPARVARRQYSAADIAADVAMAIAMGSIGAGERVPSQRRLMAAYGVAEATAAAALGRLRAIRMVQSETGRGTFATPQWQNQDILDILSAAAMCRSVTSVAWGHGDTLMTPCSWLPPGSDHGEDFPPYPPRVDVSALVALDRHLVRWMSEALYDAARRAIGSGLGEADGHLLAAARSVLRAGGRKPEGQPPIAHYGGPVPDGEDYVFRIWPERRNPPNGPDDPPF